MLQITLLPKLSTSSFKLKTKFSHQCLPDRKDHFHQKPTEPTITETVSKQEAQQVGDKTEYHQVSTVIAKANPARHHEGDPVELIPANIPDTIGDECHAADDVPLNAEGPGSEYFNGVMDNTEVFFGIMRALGMDATKTAK